MWIAKFKLKHDCILGNRCEKYNVILQSIDLNEESKGKKVLTFSLHKMIGEEKNIKDFISDLKKDERVANLEFNGNTLFLVEKAKKKPASFFIKKKMFLLKPAVIDTKGYEHWEIASYKKEILSEFIDKTIKIVDQFELLQLKETKLKDIYFPKVFPELTEKQKRAIELAIEHGYYQSPKRISLRDLAKLMNISLATYQKHLQVAESKVIPDVIFYLK